MGDTMEFRSAFGISMKAMVVAFLVVGVIFIAGPIFTVVPWSIVLIGIGIVFILIDVLIVAMYAVIRYVLTDEGILIKGTSGGSMLHEEYLDAVVPYANVFEIDETRDISYSIALSTDALRIRYIKKNGKKDAFTISPDRKELFISELSKRTNAVVIRKSGSS